MAFSVFLVGAKNQKSADCRKRTGHSVRRYGRKPRKQTEQLIFEINGVAIENVQEFLYREQIPESHNNDAPEIERNLKRARMKWGKIGKQLMRKGFKVKKIIFKGYHPISLVLRIRVVNGHRYAVAESREYPTAAIPARDWTPHQAAGRHKLRLHVNGGDTPHRRSGVDYEKCSTSEGTHSEICGN